MYQFSMDIIDDKRCDECHGLNDRHRIDSYHWIKKSRNKKKDNQAQIDDTKKQKEEKENQYQQE